MNRGQYKKKSQSEGRNKMKRVVEKGDKEEI